MGVQWYFIVVLNCISLMTNVEHFLMGILVIIQVPSIVKCLVKSFPLLKVGFLFITEL